MTYFTRVSIDHASRVVLCSYQRPRARGCWL